MGKKVLSMGQFLDEIRDPKHGKTQIVVPDVKKETEAEIQKGVAARNQMLADFQETKANSIVSGINDRFAYNEKVARAFVEDCVAGMKFQSHYLVRFFATPGKLIGYKPGTKGSGILLPNIATTMGRTKNNVYVTKPIEDPFGFKGTAVIVGIPGHKIGSKIEFTRYDADTDTDVIVPIEEMPNYDEMLRPGAFIQLPETVTIIEAENIVGYKFNYIPPGFLGDEIEKNINSQFYGWGLVKQDEILSLITNQAAVIKAYCTPI